MSKPDHCNIKTSVPWRGVEHGRDLRIWLIDNIRDYNAYYIYGRDIDNPDNRIVWFAHEKDAVLFLLRWS